MTKKPGLGVVIGRFQVPNLHDGHKFIIEEARRHQRTLVLIGTHPGLLTKNHPLDYPTREAMIKSHYLDVMVAPLPDQPTDEQWSKLLDQIILDRHPIGEVCIYGGPDSFIPHYKGKFNCTELPMQRMGSGTLLRDGIAQVVRPSEDFRAGMIYASRNVYPRILMAVDVACLKTAEESLSNFLYVLLGQKQGNPGFWRFPGGFVDINDPSMEYAAKRELREETELNAEHKMHLIGNYKIKDWREVPDSRIFTNFYATAFFAGMARPGDDLDMVQWFAATEERFRLIQFAGEHKMLSQELLKWLKTNNPIRSQN